MERVDVNGPGTHAVYTFLRSAAARVPLEARKGTPPSSGAIEWNFTKFVVGRDGQVLTLTRTRTLTLTPTLTLTLTL